VCKFATVVDQLARLGHERLDQHSGVTADGADVPDRGDAVAGAIGLMT